MVPSLILKKLLIPALYTRRTSLFHVINGTAKANEDKLKSNKRTMLAEKQNFYKFSGTQFINISGKTC